MDGAQSWFDANAGWIGFASAVLGVVSFVISIWFYFLSLRPKQLGWRMVTNNQRIRSSPHMIDGFNIGYNGQLLSDPVVSIVRIQNSGKVEIRKEDWELPVQLRFEHGRIVESSVSGKSDPNIDASLVESKAKPRLVALKPLLLNKGEWVDVQITTVDTMEEPSIAARIAGVAGKISDMERRARRLRSWMVWSLFGGLTFSIFWWWAVLESADTTIVMYVAPTISLLYLLAAWASRARKEML